MTFNSQVVFNRHFSSITAFAQVLLVAIAGIFPHQGNAEDLAPKSTGDSTVIRDQAYGLAAGKFGYCDVYLPAGPVPAEGFPVVIVIHGGAWMTGDKWTLEGYSRCLAKRGIASVTINYRLAPAVTFPAPLDDVRDALIWTSRQTDTHGFDPNRLGIFGYSAGGHLALLCASIADQPIGIQATASAWPPSDPRWGQLPRVQAVCAGGAPCDFGSLPIDNTSLAYFLGGSRRQLPKVYQTASPIEHVSQADPVTQIIHGADDLIVPVASSQRFHARQKDRGVDSRMTEISGQGHMLTFLNPSTRELVADFFHQQFFP